MLKAQFQLSLLEYTHKASGDEDLIRITRLWDSDTACSQVDCMEVKLAKHGVAHLLWNDRRERTLCQLAMTNLSPARHTHSPSLANRTGWKMVLQKESVLCLLCHLIPLLRIHLRACTIHMQVIDSGLLPAMPGMQSTTVLQQ